MKKLLLAVAAFAMLFTSCAKDDVVTPVEDKEALVSFCVNSPAVATRYGEGEEATTLYWAVYNADGSIVEALKGLKEIKLSTTVDLKLIQGREYDVLFWAADANAPYTVNWDDKTMTVNYQNLTANQESYDAFFKYESLGRVSGSMSKTIELTRPFAQLNIATGDTTDATNAELTVAKTEVKVSNIYTKLNFATGFVSEPKEATFVMANKADGKITANGNEYDHIAMNYILVGKENENSQDKKLVNVELTINDEGLTRNYSSVPVQRNYRTNIVGNILTSPAEFNVVIMPGFTQDDYISAGFVGVKVNGAVYNTLEEALANAYDGDVIELDNNSYVFPTQISTKGTRASARHLKFVGQGDTSVLSFNTTPGGADGGLNCYVDGLSLSFQDLKIVSPNTGSAYTGGFGGATSVYFKDCTYEGQYRSLAKTKFDGCTIDPKNSYIYTDYYDVDFTNCTFNASEGKAIQVYNDGNATDTTIKITDCTFTAAKVGLTWDKKPVTAIDINSNGEIFTVYINNTTATGFGVGGYSESDLWNIKGGEDFVTVYIDGEKQVKLTPIKDAEGNTVEGVGLDKDGNYVITAAAGMNWFANEVDNGNSFEGKTIKLDTDIILPEDTNWNPIGDNRKDDGAFSGTFDGQGHLISGAKITGDFCFDGTVYGSKEGWGLFSVLDGATVKNLKLDKEVFASYTVISGAVAGYAQDTTFENIEITNTKIAGYNWYTGGVVGWAGGNCTFKGINLDDTVSVGTLWDSHGQNTGGIAGGVSGEATITIEDCNIACVMDVINDITSNYKWGIYRVSGMIIGNTNTTEVVYNTVVTATATNVTCKNVTVTYGDWMNYHYCEGYWNRGWGRVESSDYVGGIDHTQCNHPAGEEHYKCIAFDQLFGGSSNGSGHYPVKGLKEFPGVTVNYPASYTPED